MDEEDQFELSLEKFPGQQLLQQNEYTSDMMIQPITTQERFNMKKQLSQNINSNQLLSPKNQEQKIKNSLESSQQSPQLPSSRFEDQQTRKFREYLNQKVNQIKKQKQRSKQLESPVKQSSKSTHLRKIITQQQNKQKQNDKSSNHKNKLKDSTQEQQQSVTDKINNHQENNKKKTIQPSSTSTSAYKDIKNDEKKKFSNSHTNLTKNVNKQQRNMSQIKRSADLSKTPKLPSLTPNLKPPSITNSKKQISLTSTNFENKQTSKIPKPSNLTQPNIGSKKQTQPKTPEQPNKNSFRIKRASNNLIPAASHNQSLSIQDESKQSRKQLAQSPVHASKNKKIKEQFIRLNEQERILQKEIFKLHSQNKKVIDTMMKKYHLLSDRFEKYGIKKQQPPPSHQSNKQQSHNINQSHVSKIVKSPSKKTISADQPNIPDSPLKKQQKFNGSLSQQVQKLNNLLKQKQKIIKKSQSKIDKNQFTNYMKNLPQDIQQMDEQDQEQDINQLPTQMNPINDKQSQNQSRTHYSQIMNSMKHKKWGLQQRITFQTHRQIPDSSLSKIQSKPIKPDTKTTKNIQSTPNYGIDTNEEDNHANKISVNSRLKNLLLD